MAEDFDRSAHSNNSSTFDVCLLLRAHAEARWLGNELAPVLREIEAREEISELQLGAALAYLEVLWIEAGARARETEAARVELDALGGADEALAQKARRYHAAVRRLRDGVQRRVSAQLTTPPGVGVPPRAPRVRERRISDRPSSS
jgi:hypothetical protein